MELENAIKKNKINESDAFICIKCNFSANAPSIWLAHSKTIKHQNNMLGIEHIKEYHFGSCQFIQQRKKDRKKNIIVIYVIMYLFQNYIWINTFKVNFTIQK